MPTDLFKFNLGENIKDKKMFSEFWNLSKDPNNTKKITISKDGLDLFTGDLQIDGENGKFKFNNALKLADGNYQGNLTKEDGKLKTIDPSKLDLSREEDQGTYLENLLYNFKKDLDEVKKFNEKPVNKDKPRLKYRKVFDKYFKKGKSKEKGGIYTEANKFKDGTDGRLMYFGDLKKGEKDITREEIFRKYFAQIIDAYYKYKEEYIFEQLAQNIVSSEDVLFVPRSSDKSFKQTLAEYIVNTISEFNPSLTEGSFASDGAIAITVQQRDALSQQKVNPDLILIAYNNNGEAINAGDYIYDSSDLLEYGLRLETDIARFLLKYHYYGKT